MLAIYKIFMSTFMQEIFFFM